MKHLYLLLLLFFSFGLTQAIAQKNLYAEQRFNRTEVSFPYIGYDLLRLKSPLIIAQQRTANGSWVNLTRYETVFDVFRTDLLTNKSTYDFDVNKGAWIDGFVDKYEMNIHKPSGVVINSKNEKRYGNSTYNANFSSLFFINAQNLADSEYLYVKSGSDSSLIVRFLMKYDQNGKIIMDEYIPQSGLRLKSYYSYQAGQLVQKTTLRINDQLQTTDSSSKTIYTYDSFGRCIQHVVYLFDVPDAPDLWMANSGYTYEYDSKSLLIKSVNWRNTASGNFDFVPYEAFHYYYDPAGVLSTFIQTNYSNGVIIEHNKIVINYSNNKMVDALEFGSTDSVYSTIPSYRYLVSEFPLGLSTSLLPEFNGSWFYPNPTKNKMTLPYAKEGELCKVFDATGNFMNDYLVNSSNEIDGLDLKSGLYLILWNGNSSRFLIE